MAVKEKEGCENPDYVIACIGGGSKAGTFLPLYTSQAYYSR
jgi:tryptophan synthase beta subunit